jgi:hypothetical protein
LVPVPDGHKFRHGKFPSSRSPVLLAGTDLNDARNSSVRLTVRSDGNPEPVWHIEGQNFDLRLRAAGYTQYLRLPPQLVPRQNLTSAERSGISFAEQSFA